MNHRYKHSGAAIIVCLLLGLACGFALPTSAHATGSISGYITDDVTGQGIQGALVTLTLVNGTGPAPSDVLTDANGAYMFSTVNDGTYSVKASKLPEYSEVTWAGRYDSSTHGMVTTITVPNGGSANISLHRSTSSTVSGTVKNASSLLPISGASVKGTSTSGGINWSASTDATGSYSAQAVPGTYDIKAQAWGYSSVTHTVGLIGGSNTQDFLLTPLATTTLSGTVTDGTAGIPGATVTLYCVVSGDSAGVTLTAVTDASGNYSFTVPMGSTNTVGVSASGYYPPASQTVVASTNPTVVNFTLVALPPEPTRLRGQVIACGTGSLPVLTGSVLAFNVVGGIAQGEVARVPFDSANTYRFTGLPVGDYYLWAVPDDRVNYCPNYYSTTLPCTILDWHDATMVTLAASQQLSGVNIQVEGIASTNSGTSWTLFGTISVTAQAKRGDGNSTASYTDKPLDSVGVIARDSTGKIIKYEMTDAMGNFMMKNMPRGTYHLYVNRIGYDVVLKDSIVHLTSIDTPTVTVNFKMLRQGTTGVHDAPVSLPGAFALHENFPNPFNGATTMSFSLQHAGAVLLEVRDVLGRTVSTVVNGTMSQGDHAAQFNAAGLQPGVYFSRLASEGRAVVRPMVITR